VNDPEQARATSAEALSERADAPDSRPTSRCEGSTFGGSVGNTPTVMPNVPGYEIISMIGRGGMGVVYKARHERLERVVALKVIVKDHISSESDAIQRFQREARSAARLFHPNIVVLFDAGEAGDCCFIAMEYVDGVDLHQLVKDRGPLPIEQACDYIRQAATGLQHAFEAGLVHRDIKPSNLLVARPAPGVLGYGVVKILDMGLAVGAHSTNSASANWTQQGALMGTPDYIAPEQAIDSHAVDTRADLYSLGFTLYYMLTGKAPFGSEPLLKKLMMHQTTDPRPVQELRPEVPAGLAAIVHKLAKKNPAERYQTPTELIAALLALKSAGVPTPGAPAPGAPATPTRASQLGNPTDPSASTPGDDIPLSPTLAALLRKPSDPNAPPPAKKPTPAPAPPTPAPRRTPSSAPRTAHAGVPVHAAPRPEEALPPGVERADKIGKLEGHRGSVAALAFTRDRSTLYSGGLDGDLRRWDMTEANNRDLLLQQSPHRADIAAVAISPNDKFLAAGSGNIGDVVTVWDLTGEEPTVRITIPARHNAVEALAFDHTNKFLAGGGTNFQVHVWDVSGKTPSVRFVLKGHQEAIKAMAFAADSDVLASADQDGTVRTWNLGRGIFSKDAARFEGEWGAVRTLAFSPKEPFLAFGALDHHVRLCDLANGGGKWATLEGHPGGIRLVQFSRNGKTLLSLCDSGHVILWNVETGAKEREWKLSRSLYTSATLTRDGHYLAAGESGGTVALFRLHSHE
jgi:serine/threonine protein kinase/WD40 repeat protein